MKRLSLIFISFFLCATLYAQDGEVGNTNEEGVDTEEGNGTSEEGTKKAEVITALRAEDNGGYNPLSRRPIHLSQQMYRKTIWRKLDLREKQNKPLFSQGRELSRILISAVREGKVVPYTTDSTNRPMSIEEFNEALMIPGADVEEDDGFGDEGGWGDEEEEGGDDGGWGDDAGEEEVISPYYMENGLYVFEIKEDMIFDNQRSRMYNDILSIGMKIPADNADNLKGIEEAVAFFRYVDLVNNVFGGDDPDPRSFWYNPQNDAAHRSMQDAFDLRLFSSYIVKISNPAGDFLEDIYGSPEAGVRASYKTMYELLEYEHNLWEY